MIFDVTDYSDALKQFIKPSQLCMDSWIYCCIHNKDVFSCHFIVNMTYTVSAHVQTLNKRLAIIRAIVYLMRNAQSYKIDYPWEL